MRGAGMVLLLALIAAKAKRAFRDWGSLQQTGLQARGLGEYWHPSFRESRLSGTALTCS
jgi:hypothetical protein